MEHTHKTGLTTTVPVEVLYAAGKVPVDLNNIFVVADNARELVALAERRGFPQSACAWVKGLYATVKAEGIAEVVGVVEGDCSQNVALIDLWRSEGVRIIPFSFPGRYALASLRAEIAEFARQVGADLARAEEIKAEFDRIRQNALEIDRLACERGSVSSGELFSSQLLLTDFLGEPALAAQTMSTLLAGMRKRPADSGRIRLGVAGVPTILSDLWEVIEENNGRVVYHEVPHQFCLFGGIGKPLAEAFLDYTYPQPASIRVAEIARQVRARGIRGIIHYVQSFCHRQLHDMILRQGLEVPVLTIEADGPGPVDGRTRTRIEAFLEQLAD